MIAFANAKINIGLQVLRRRADGYHDLETVFYPLGIHDVIEVIESNETKFHTTGMSIPHAGQDNLCLQAYDLIKARMDIPPVDIYLHKVIPVGAGLGGGSSDAAAVLRLLNSLFALGLTDTDLLEMAGQLGADCPFFIRNKPVFATGTGNVFKRIDINLSRYYLVLIKPDVHIDTGEAYGSVIPNDEGNDLATAIHMPVSEWKKNIKNDFEPGIFEQYPVIGQIKSQLYQAGALYAAMSGSGSSVFGIFEKKTRLDETFQDDQVFYVDRV